MQKDHYRYQFEEVLVCEMCGASTAHDRVLGQRLNKTQGMRPGRKSGITVTVKKCRKCRLIYSSPQPIPFDIQDHYGIPTENYWHSGYFTLDPAYFSGEIATAKKLLGFQPGMKSLDIGAGIGKGMIALENAGFESWGFEPSKPFYERAVGTMNIPKERIRLGMIEEMEYPESTFDFISFGAVFEHLYHPAASLQKAFSWLKPGGIIHIEVPSSQYLAAKLVNTFYRMTGTTYVCNLSPMHVPFHLYEFSIDSFRELCNKHTWSIKHYQYFVGISMILPRILRPVLDPIMRWTNTGMQLTVYLSR